VKVLEVSSKRMLKSASSRGEGVSSILDKQIDELSRDISRGVGLGERTVQTDQAPIADVTTTSMEAYNYFLRGHDDLEKFYYDDAIQFLEKAIQHDSTFAVAYLYLARAYSNLLNEKARNAAYEKAKRYSIKSTEKERLFIDAAYAGTIEKNPEQRLYVLKQIARKYPREKRVHYELGTHYSGHEAIEELSKALALDPDFGPAINQIAYEYAEMGAFEKAIDCFKRYAAVSPGDANPLDSMADLFWRMGKLDEAIAKYEEAFEVKPGFSKALESLIYVYAMQEKYSESMRWLDQLIATTTTPGQQAKNYWIKGFFDLWLGKTKQALLDINQARKLFESVGNKYGIAGTDWLEAYLRNDCGEQERGLECYQKWLVYLRDNIPATLTGFIPRCNLYRGLINLKQGQIDSARSRLAEIKSSISQQNSPATRAEITYRYELLNGEIALAEGKPNEAIAIFEKMTTQPIPKGPTYPWIVQYSTPFQIYGLARAYLKAGNRDRAVAEYERLITFDPKAMDRYLIHPKYHYHLANLYAEQGLQAKAIAQFQKYLEIWKDADEDLSDRTDAQVKLAKLIRKK
jgi:tetratricopeptide (TPR) repeat protein